MFEISNTTMDIFNLSVGTGKDEDRYLENLDPTSTLKP